MGRYLRRRLLTAIPVFFGITILVFCMLNLAQGSILDLMGEGSGATDADRAALAASLGLDLPLPQRYLMWLGDLLRGDLGVSYANGKPVAGLIAQRVGPSLLLTGTGVVLAVAIALPLGELVKQTRAACLEALGEDYIRTARAKGLTDGAVMVRHAFRGALIPVLTTILSHIPHILGGSVVVEQIFGWPGMGSLLFSGISGRDYTVVMGVTVVIALTVLLTNLLLDLVYGLADPRVRYGKE